MSAARPQPRTPGRRATRSTTGARPVERAAVLSTVLVAAACCVGLLLPTSLARHQLPVLVAGFLVGLPHGAVDHLVPFWTGWVRRRLVTMLVVLAGYVGVAATTWAGLRWAGPVVLPLLLVLSVLHFGTGDLMAAREDRPTPRRMPPTLLVAGVLARGGPVVAGPLLAWPAQTRQALAAVGAGTGLPGPSVRLVVALLVAACTVLVAVEALGADDPGSAVEVVLLAALFVVVPPLAAFGVYFGAWHGLRHTARLIARDPRNQADLQAGRLLRPVRRFLVSAAPPSLVATSTAAVLVLLADRHTDLAGTVFTVLLALTVPHLVVVAVLDATTLRGARGAAGRG